MKNFPRINLKNQLTNSELKQIVGGTLKRPPKDEDINPPLHFLSASIYVANKRW